MARDPQTRIRITAKDEASGVFGTLQRNAGKVAAAITAFFSFRMFKSGIDGAAEFEEQMSKVEAITRSSGAELRNLQTAAENAGATTRYTATEAAQALENLSRAGFNATEAVEALPGVLALAQANGVELAEAASLVTRAVRGMGLEVAESGRVADVLTEAAAKANTNVTGLGQALAYAAPTAQALGLSLEETVAIIGKFADAGIDASRAGTALNSILAQFSNPASKFRQELAAAGITTGDFNLALRQLAEAGPRGQRAIIAVGQEAGPALRALLNQGIGSLDELRAALEAADGAAGRTAATMDGNLRGATRGFGSAWESVRNKILSPLLDPLAEQINRVTTQLREFVSSGAAGRFGGALAEAFTKAVKFADEFIQKLDFQGVLSRMEDFASRTDEILTRAAGYGTAFGQRFEQVFSSLSLIWNGFRMTVLAAGEAIAGVLSNITAAFSALAGVAARLSFGPASESLRKLADDSRAVAEELWTLSEEYARRAGAAANDVTESWGSVVALYGDVATAANDANEAVNGVGGAVADASEANILMVEELTALEQGFAKMNEQAGKTTETIKGNTAAAKENASTMDAGVAKAQEVADAYQRLGITSKAALQEAAENAKRDFEIIRDSGTATTKEIAAAFAVYAEKAIAANDGVASAALQAEAAQLGLKVAADEAGRVTVTSMEEAARATAKLREESDAAAASIGVIGEKAAEAANEMKGLNSAAESGSSGGGGGGRSSFTSPLANLLPRGRRVGGLAFRKEMEQLLEEWRNRQPFGGGGLASVNSTAKELYNLLNDRIDEEQIRREGGGEKFPDSRTGATFSVDIGLPGGGREIIRTATYDDGQRLAEILGQLQTAQRTAA